MKILDWLHGSEKEIEAKRVPKKGEIWGLVDVGPWPSEKTVVYIRDVQDGWVRYAHGGEGWANAYTPYKDERKTIQDFTSIFLYSYTTDLIA